MSPVPTRVSLEVIVRSRCLCSGDLRSYDQNCSYLTWHPRARRAYVPPPGCDQTRGRFAKTRASSRVYFALLTRIPLALRHEQRGRARKPSDIAKHTVATRVPQEALAPALAWSRAR
eukprot:7064160-Pyramimonas_sp.AAC.1